MTKRTDAFHEVAQSMVNLNWELKGDLNVAANEFCEEHTVLDYAVVRAAMVAGAVAYKRRELLNLANEARRAAGDSLYEVWASQGQGGGLDEAYPTLEAALAHVERHKGEASYGIKLPDGTWYNFESGFESINFDGPCISCGEITDLACTDCRIDFQKTTFVCRKTACRDTHERVCAANAVEEL